MYVGVHCDHDLTALNVCIDSPWLKMFRTVAQTAEGLQVETVAETFRASLTPQELLSEQFARLQAEYNEKFHATAIIVKPL